MVTSHYQSHSILQNERACLITSCWWNLHFLGCRWPEGWGRERQGWCPSEVSPPWQQHQASFQQVQQVPERERDGTEGILCLVGYNREVAWSVPIFVNNFGLMGSPFKFVWGVWWVYLARGPSILVSPPTIEEKHINKHIIFQEIFNTRSFGVPLGPNFGGA